MTGNSWREVDLGEVVEFLDYKRRPLNSTERAVRQGPYPYYGASGPFDSVDGYLFDGRYLLVAEDGENLNSRKLPVAFFATGRFWVNNHAHIIRGLNGVADDEFLKHWFAGNNISGYITGAAQPKLSQASMKRIRLLLPNYAAQRRIASILSAYDDLIENNTRRIAILEEMARRLYEEWFVRFRFPGHEGVRMVESELGLVPEGWRVRLLGDEIELPYGKALKAENRSAGEVPVYGSSGVVGCHSTSLVPGPGIIVGRKGNVGSVHWCDVPFFPIDTVFYVKAALPLHFVYFNLQQQNFLNNDAAVPGLNRNQAYALPLLVPDLDVLNRFEDLCGQLLGMARLLSRKNVNLRTTRDLLLPKLISGELDVSTLLELQAETP